VPSAAPVPPAATPWEPEAGSLLARLPQPIAAALVEGYAKVDGLLAEYFPGQDRTGLIVPAAAAAAAAAVLFTTLFALRRR